MVDRLGLGPVFAYESLTASRRWQVYAGRALLVFGLLAALALVWSSQIASVADVSLHDLARVGHAFYTAMMGVQLVLVLLVAPAATAGAICQDKGRGGLVHLLLTDLSDAEIVLGKLAARLASVLGIVAGTLPVLVLSTLLGGVDPAEVFAGSLVIVGVAVLGVCVALTFSVWATKSHEALTATYAVWAVWLLGLIAWDELGWGARSRWVRMALIQSHPFWLIFNNGSLREILAEDASFLAGCLMISALLTILAIAQVRSVALRTAGRAASRACRSRSDVPLLDRDPILWRERHRRRPSSWSRGTWWLYATIATTFTLLSIVEPDIAPGTNGFQIAIGLLLVCVSASTALADERAQDGLDVVLATPLSTRSIVLGKWRGAFRPVPRLAILPGLLMAGLSVNGQGRPARFPGEGIVATALVVLLVLAYGAAIVSLGLLAATWQRRPGRAIALCVTAYLAATLAWPAVLLMSTNRFRGGSDIFWLGISPFYGGVIPPIATYYLAASFADGWMPYAPLLMIAFATAAALGLGLVLATFDRCLGRVPERPRRPTPSGGRRGPTRNPPENPVLPGGPQPPADPRS